MRNLKKVISSVAALAIAASSASAFAVTFPDVDASASYANAVDTLVALNIVNGDDKGLFNPDNNVTRAEFTKMAVGALGETAAAEAQVGSQFTDAATTQQHWAAGFIAQGVADGFINGMGDGRFAPDEQVTYAQAAKMLVSSVGYTSFAEAAGGWPSGYVAQATSLGITKGVSATNDTALTRAQCAIMINNALQVPLNVIETYQAETTLTGTVMVPKYIKKDGTYKEYQTLLTDRHDAYVVKGRVLANYQGASSGLNKDEVTYNVEVADNFDDITYGNSHAAEKSFTMKFGTTDAPNMLFAYTEAIVQKDEDSSEYTILSITNYGASKTVEFYASDVADDATNIGVKYADAKQLPVYKGSSSSTTKYDLSWPETSTSQRQYAQVYVNGNRYTDLSVTSASNNKNFDKAISDYILNNSTGKVTLVDRTTSGSTSTDGYYDYIMIDYYVDAVVDYVQTTGSAHRVYFKQATESNNRMGWDPDKDDIDIKFIKDGAEIAYTDLEENDILSIKYNITSGDKLSDLNKGVYEVLVSSQTVAGTVTSKDPSKKTATHGGDWTITIDGTEYDVAGDTSYIQVDNDKTVEIGTEYTVYLDAFGYIAYIDEGASSKNYGVVVAMTKSQENDMPSVRIVTADGKVVSYECKGKDETLGIYNTLRGVATAANLAQRTANDTDNMVASKSTLANDINAGRTVVTYKLSSGKIKSIESLDNTNGVPVSSSTANYLEYKASSNKVGSYTIKDSVTRIIDMSDYIRDNTVSTMSVADFEDETEYAGFFFDKNSDGDYRFAVILDGASSLRPATQIAVVKKSNGTTELDSQRCDAYTIVKGTEESTLYVVEQNTKFDEGSVIAYVVGSDGYVDDNKFACLYTPNQTYATTVENTDKTKTLTSGLLYDVVSNQYFGDELDSNFAKPITDTKTVGNRDFGKYELNYYGKVATSKPTYAYMGVVYRKSGNSLELILGKDNTITYSSLNSAQQNEYAEKNIATASDTSALKYTKDFNIAGANTYYYDYSEARVGKGGRVSASVSANQSTSPFNTISMDSDNFIAWDYKAMGTNEVAPQLALIKEVDGDVTDVVFFSGEY